MVIDRISCLFPAKYTTPIGGVRTLLYVRSTRLLEDTISGEAKPQRIEIHPPTESNTAEDQSSECVPGPWLAGGTIVNDFQIALGSDYLNSWSIRHTLHDASKQ